MPTTTVRIVQTLAGSTCLNPGDVATIDSAIAARLIAAGDAFPALPSLDAAIAAALVTAGMTHVTLTNGAWVDFTTGDPITVGAGGAFTFDSAGVLHVIYPTAQAIFDVTKARPGN